MNNDTNKNPKSVAPTGIHAADHSKDSHNKPTTSAAPQKPGSDDKAKVAAPSNPSQTKL